MAKNSYSGSQKKEATKRAKVHTGATVKNESSVLFQNPVENIMNLGESMGVKKVKPTKTEYEGLDYQTVRDSVDDAFSTPIQTSTPAIAGTIPRATVKNESSVLFQNPVENIMNLGESLGVEKVKPTKTGYEGLDYQTLRKLYDTTFEDEREGYITKEEGIERRNLIDLYSAQVATGDDLVKFIAEKTAQRDENAEISKLAQTIGTNNARNMQAVKITPELFNIANSAGDKADFYSDIVAIAKDKQTRDNAQKKKDDSYYSYGSYAVENGATNTKYHPTGMTLEKYDIVNKANIKGEKNDIYGFMTGEELNLYNALYNGGHKDKAKEFLSSIEGYLQVRMSDYQTKIAREYGEKHPYSAGLESAVTSVVGGIPAALDNIGEFLFKGEVDTYDSTSRFMRNSQAYRQGGSEYMKNKYGETGEFLYNTGASMAEFGLNLLIGKGLGKIAGAIGTSANTANSIASNTMTLNMGANATANTMIDIADRGGEDWQIITGGMAAGFAEYVFEKVSIDKLFNAKTAGTVAQGFKGYAQNAFRNIPRVAGQAITEGSEELFTSAANLVTDAIIMSGKSESAIKRQAYLKQGMTIEEASRQVFVDTVKQLALDTAGGMLSGSIIGGANITMQDISHTRYMESVGEKMMNAPTVMNSVVSMGLETNNAEAVAFAKKVQDGGSVTGKEAGRVIESVLTENIRNDGGMMNIAKNIATLEGGNVRSTQELFDTAKAVMHLATGDSSEVDDALISRSQGAMTLLSAVEGDNKAVNSIKDAAAVELRDASQMQNSEGKVQSEILRSAQNDDGVMQSAKYGVRSEGVSPTKAKVSEINKSLSDADIYSHGEKISIPEDAKMSDGIVISEASEKFRKSNREGYNVIKKFAKDTGTTVLLVNDAYSFNENGEIEYIDGMETTGGIIINLDSKDPVRFATTHEFGHRTKKLAPKEWGKYQNYVIERKKVNGEYYTAYNLKKRAYGDKSSVIDEEIAADYIGDMFKSQDELVAFIEEDRTLAVKVRDMWYSVLDYFGRLDEKKKAQLLWRKAYREAMQNRDVKSSGEIKFSKTLYQEYFKTFSKNTLNEIKMKNGILITSKGELLSAINKSLDNPSLQENYYISAIEEELKEKIENDINVSLFKPGEYSFVISSDDVRHISKHFANAEDIVEAIYRLYDVVNNYDSIKYEIEGTKNKLIFEKSYSDYDFLSVEIVSKKNKSLDLVSFYVTKNNKKNRPQNDSFANTSKSGLASQGVSQPTKVNISQKETGVNSKKSISGTRLSEYEGGELPFRSSTELGLSEQKAPKESETKEVKRKISWNKAEIKKKIDSDYNYISSMLREPTDRRHIPEDLRGSVAFLLDQFNFETKQIDRLRAEGKEADSPTAVRLSKMYDAYADIMRKAWGIDKSAEKSELMDSYLSEDLQALRDEIPVDESGEYKRIQDMSVEELRSVAKVLTSIHHVITTRNKAFNSAIKEEVSELGQSASTDMQKIRSLRKGSGDRLDYNGMVKMLDKYFNLDNVQPWDFFHQMGGTIERLYMEERKSFNRHIENLREAGRVLQNATKGIELEKVTGKKAEEFEFKFESGEEITLTKGQILSLYALYQRKQGKEHILGGGIVTFGKYKDASGNKGGANNAHRVTEIDMGRVFETLSNEEKSMVNKVVDFLSKRCAEWGNETSMRLYGYEKYGEGWYFPIEVSKQTLNTYYGEKGEGTIRSHGSSKSINKKARNAVEINDFFDVVTNHVNWMSLYNTVALPMLDMERVLNYSASSVSDKVRQEIVRTFGKASERYIELFHKDINASRKTNDSDTFLEKAAGNVKKASIGLNARVLLQQPTSISRVFLFMNPRDIPAVWNAKKEIAEMQENIPIAYWKSLGFRDVGTGSSMKQVLLDNESLYDKVAMGGYGLADDFTWALLYKMVKNEVERTNKGVDTNSEEFKNKVRERFDYIVDRSQVVDSVFHRTQIMRSGNVYTKTATMFMSEPLKTYNMYRTEVLDAAKNGTMKTKLPRATAVFVVSNLLLSLAQALPDTWREDDEKELFKDGKDVPLWKIYFKKFKEAMADNSNPLTYMPYIKDVWSLIQGYSMDRIEYSGISNLVSSAKALMNNQKTITSRLFKFGISAAAIFGFSPGNLVRDVKGFGTTVYRMVGDEYADYLMTKWDWEATNPKNQSKFMKYYKRAIANGHTDDAETILTDYLSERFKGEDFDNPKVNKVITEMSKLYEKKDVDKENKSNLIYNLPDDEFSFDGKKIKISEEDYPEYVSGAYKKLFDMAYEFVTSDEYKKLSDDDKIRGFGDLRSYVQGAQRMEDVKGYELEGWQKEVYKGKTTFSENVFERAEDRKYEEKLEEYKESFEFDESKYSTSQINKIVDVEEKAASYYVSKEMGREYDESKLRHIKVYDEQLKDEMPIEKYAEIRAFAKTEGARLDPDGSDTNLGQRELYDYLETTDYPRPVKEALFEAIGSKNWTNLYNGKKIQ